MNSDRNNVRRSVTFIGAVLFAILLLLSQGANSQAPTDIEKEFMPFNSSDLSGTYQAIGVGDDSSTYNVPVTLTKWHTFKTQRGNVLLTFKLNYVVGETKYNGIAVFDGHRLYYASCEGNNEHYSVSILGKLVLSTLQQGELANFWHLLNKGYSTGKYAKWKGKSPWFGYFRVEDDLFGYKFHMDGTWSEFTSYGHGYPPVPGTGRSRTLVLKSDGEHDDKDYERHGTQSDESNGLVIQKRGENLIMSFTKYDSWKNGPVEAYGGSGMLMVGRNTNDSILVAMTGGVGNTQYGWMDIVKNRFKGVWSWLGADSRSTEVWEPSEEVATRNPHLFKQDEQGTK